MTASYGHCCFIASLLSYALTNQDAQRAGWLRFEFPAGLIPIIKEPRRFARLRIHFLLSLSGKYAVTLYELLESAANKIEPVLEVPLEQLRQWLKVPDGKLTRYQDLRRRVLQPAIRQINDNPLSAGFTVTVQPLKQGRAFQAVRFTVHKIDERRRIEAEMQPSPVPSRLGNEPPVSPRPPSFASSPVLLQTETYAKARRVAPDLDVYDLERQWQEWRAGKPVPANADAAFIAFCRRKQQRSTDS